LYLEAVDPTRFVAPSLGKVVKTPGPYGFFTYLPAPLPRKMTLSSSSVLVLSEADRALGRLAGAGRLLPNPHLLVDPYVAREALSSSRIEGTQASLSDVFDATALGAAKGQVREVTNYIAALNQGLRLLSELPLSMRLVKQIHAVLLSDVRGQERNPGEIRTSPNWIGSPDGRPETATFVPPPVDQMTDALTDWERFIHEDLPIPPLVKCALLHYQFETIHPFLDGNGRLGRLLIVFFLVERALLPQPLLYVSSFLEAHRSEYYERLQLVREEGQLEEWLQFFLRAVAVQARDSARLVDRLADLRETYRRTTGQSRSRAPEVVELLFANPIITVRHVTNRLHITQQGAANLIRRLEGAGLLKEYGRVPGRAMRWVAQEILDILESPTGEEAP
jgi:Fic family protein